MRTFEKIQSHELEPLLKFWQRWLRLQDWDITAAIVGADKMDGNNRGEVEYEQQYTVAQIRLLRAEDYTAEEWHPLDQEVILLHELQHIKLYWTDEAIETNPTLNNYLEHTVDTSARTLVKLARTGGEAVYKPLFEELDRLS